jgi:hypothetical protein
MEVSCKALKRKVPQPKKKVFQVPKSNKKSFGRKSNKHRTTKAFAYLLKTQKQT